MSTLSKFFFYHCDPEVGRRFWHNVQTMNESPDEVKELIQRKDIPTIRGAFVWGASPEGRRFWSNIEERYNNFRKQEQNR